MGKLTAAIFPLGEDGQLEQLCKSVTSTSYHREMDLEAAEIDRLV